MIKNKFYIRTHFSGISFYILYFYRGLLYTLSWSTACPSNNILATGGTNCTIVLIDLKTHKAYLHYSLPQANKKIFISSILFHPSQNVLFSEYFLLDC